MRHKAALKTVDVKDETPVSVTIEGEEILGSYSCLIVLSRMACLLDNEQEWVAQ